MKIGYLMNLWAPSIVISRTYDQLFLIVPQTPTRISTGTPEELIRIMTESIKTTQGWWALCVSNNG